MDLNMNTVMFASANFHHRSPRPAPDNETYEVTSYREKYGLPYEEREGIDSLMSRVKKVQVADAATSMLGGPPRAGKTT